MKTWEEPDDTYCPRCGADSDGGLCDECQDRQDEAEERDVREYMDKVRGV